MRYIWQHTQNIIEGYDGKLPLSHFLKKYFKDRPKLGSRDRKLLSELVYCWYRCSRGIRNSEPGIRDMELEAKACMFLCGTQEKIINDFLGEDWGFDAGMSTDERLQVIEEKGMTFDAGKLFTGRTELSEGITKEEWLASMLHKPKLFIRIRKNKAQLIAILNENNIPFEEINENCLALPIGAAIDTMLPADCYAVQDASSQATGSFFKPNKNEAWYDCCSGAGGKSLLLKDMEPSVQLSISDTRESIIQNLKTRFKLYHLEQPTIYNIDVANKEAVQQKLGDKQFDAIICDAPCSGSGTWARTPEQLYFFEPKRLTQFAKTQKNIAANVSAYLKRGGKLIYITCSVFKEENEDVVKELVKQGLQSEQMQMINGVQGGADSMFVAVLKK